MVKETPAAPNTKAVLRRFRLELCFVRAMVGLHCQSLRRKRYVLTRRCVGKMTILSMFSPSVDRPSYRRASLESYG